MTPDELADDLNRSRQSVYRMIRNGLVPAIRHGRSLLIPTARAEQALGLPAGSLSDDDQRQEAA